MYLLMPKVPKNQLRYILNEDNDAAMVVVEVTFKESNQGIDSKKEKVRVKKINDEWKVNL